MDTRKGHSVVMVTVRMVRYCHHQLSVIMLCVLLLSWVRESTARPPQGSRDRLTTVRELIPSYKHTKSLVSTTTDATSDVTTLPPMATDETERKQRTRTKRRKKDRSLRRHKGKKSKLLDSLKHNSTPSKHSTQNHTKDLATDRSLYTRFLELESRLLKETVRSRELQDVIGRHAAWLRTLDHTVTQTSHNYSALEQHVDRMESVLDLEEGYHQSIEKKLAGVMLDVAEVSNLLSTQNKRNSVTLKDKMIDVQTPSEQARCSVTANTTKYRDCEEVYHHGHTTSGVYYITPLYASCPLPVYCDMDTPPGGWLVVQRRQDGSTDFLHDWAGYRRGFGDITDEFWLGNDNLFLLTNQGHYQLRVDLWDFYGSRVYADYLHFKVEGERDRYRLHVSNHSGTAPDSLANHDGHYFSTPDRDNDQYQQYHCAKEWSAGWWFSNCWFAFLNGKYHNHTDVEYRGISWNDWKTEQLKRVEMKIRPSGF